MSGGSWEGWERFERSSHPLGCILRWKTEPSLFLYSGLLAATPETIGVGPLAQALLDLGVENVVSLVGRLGCSEGF